MSYPDKIDLNKIDLDKIDLDMIDLDLTGLGMCYPDKNPFVDLAELLPNILHLNRILEVVGVVLVLLPIHFLPQEVEMVVWEEVEQIWELEVEHFVLVLVVVHLILQVWKEEEHFLVPEQEVESTSSQAVKLSVEVEHSVVVAVEQTCSWHSKLNFLSIPLQDSSSSAMHEALVVPLF
jgi:hypothetical protein